MPPSSSPGASSSSSDDDDAALLDALDNDPSLSHLRERRIEQLSHSLRQQQQQQQQTRDRGHHHYGTLTSIRSEKDLLEIFATTTSTSSSAAVESESESSSNKEEKTKTTTTKKQTCIVHFHTPSFARCRIMDTHLSTLASKHVRVRFLKIDVADAPFLVDRLAIKVLPCVISFVDGVGVDRVVGFEGVGEGGDGFRTGQLERRFVAAGVLKEEGEEGDVGGVLGGRRGGDGEERGKGLRRKAGDDDEDDDEWD